jgi:NADPH:quinone reductase-like Zn-dependent oxidoreductase
MLGYVTDAAAPGGLDRRELPDPEPRDGHAIVEVRAFAVNRGELSLIEQRPNGFTPGQDVAGVVRSAAPDGVGPAVGTRVAAMPDWGSWSELVSVPVHRVGAIPDQVTFEDAAALPIAGLTAYRAIETGGFLLGRRVLVTGAAGGVGHFASQLAKLAGAHVTAFVRPGRVEAAWALGVDEVVTSLDGEGAPFDLVVDGVGGSVLGAALHRVAPKGTVTIYGFASGEPGPTVSLMDFAGGRLSRIQSFFLYSTDESTFGRDVGILAGFVGDGRLHVEATTRGGWDDTRALLDALRRHEVVGKVVVTVG